jgi:hypothetical protein
MQGEGIAMNTHVKKSNHHHDKRAALMTRHAILGLLSDDEAARVSAAEARNDLAVGDEYVDLQHLEKGVQQALGPTQHEANLLPRSAVHETTWQKIQTRMLAT